MSLKKAGVDPGKRVRRRLVRLQHLLSNVIIRGIKTKEFKSVNVKVVNEMIYGLIQALIFRLAVLDEESCSEINQTFEMIISGLLIENK